MAATIELKSKALKVFDYTEMDLSKFIPAFTPDEAQLEKDIERILKAHGRKEEVETVSDGDMVMLSCDSETPKFNKRNIIVMVGKGLFSSEFENGLIGQRKDEPFTLTADDAEVRGTVEKILHVVLPALTDENVAAFGIEGVASVRDLKRYCVDKQLDRLLDDSEERDMASAMVWQALSENSDFVLDEGERERALVLADEKTAELESQEPSFESEEEEQAFLDEYEEEYGVSYVDIDMGEMVRGMYLTELKLGALGCAVAAKEGLLVTEDDYDEYIRRYQEAYPAMTEEELREKYSVEAFAKERYNAIICDRLDAFVADAFKEKMNPYR